MKNKFIAVLFVDEVNLLSTDSKFTSSSLDYLLTYCFIYTTILITVGVSQPLSEKFISGFLLTFNKKFKSERFAAHKCEFSDRVGICPPLSYMRTIMTKS